MQLEMHEHRGKVQMPSLKESWLGYGKSPRGMVTKECTSNDYKRIADQHSQSMKKSKIHDESWLKNTRELNLFDNGISKLHRKDT